MAGIMDGSVFAVSVLSFGVVLAHALGGWADESELAKAQDQCFGCGLYNYIDEQTATPEVCEAFVEASAQDGDCLLVQNVCVPASEPLCMLANVDVSLICLRDEESSFCVKYGWNWVPVTASSVWGPDLGGQLFQLPEYNLVGACGQVDYSQNFAAFMAPCGGAEPDPAEAEWAHTLGFSCFSCFRRYTLPD